jgi:hypothetical protein
MKKLIACAVAAVFGLSCAYAGAAEVTQTDEVRVHPEVKRNAKVAKKKTKRAARKAKAKTRSAANRTRAAAHRGADRSRSAANRAADRVDTTPDNSRGEAVLQRNR